MDGKPQLLTLCLTLFMILVAPGFLSSSIFAQPTTNSSDMSAPGMESAPLLEKLKGASSISNIQTVSFVDGIEVIGVNIGDSQATVTLKHAGSEVDDSNRSQPVTVLVIRTPGSSVKSLSALIEASNKLAGKNTTNPLAGLMSQMGALSAQPGGPNISSLGGLDSLNVSEPIKPLQALLQLGKDTQIGIGNIVSGDWEKPRTVTTGISTLGGLLGLEGSSAAEPRAHLAMVLVVPYSGKTSFGSVDFR